MVVTHTTTLERKVAEHLAYAPNIRNCFTDVKIKESETAVLMAELGVEQDLVLFTASAHVAHWIEVGVAKEKYRLLGVFQVSSWVEDEYRELITRRLA